MTPIQKCYEDIEWAKIEIEKAKNGGDTSPVTPIEWIECMKRRINANISVLNEYGHKYDETYP